MDLHSVFDCFHSWQSRGQDISVDADADFVFGGIFIILYMLRGFNVLSGVAEMFWDYFGEGVFG